MFWTHALFFFAEYVPDEIHIIMLTAKIICFSIFRILFGSSLTKVLTFLGVDDKIIFLS